MKMNAYLWMLLSAVAFAGGEYLSKIWAMKPACDWSLVLWINVCYLASGLFWLPAIWQTKTLAATGTFCSVLYMILTVAVGVGLCGERLTEDKWVGLVAAAAAIALLSR
jgi:drug/metabolite transporter (DMT)-like permease